MKAVDQIRETLFEMRDPAYRVFQCSLMPTVDPKTVIGIRTPALRRYAKTLWREGNADGFLAKLPHAYYEENNLHAFLIEQMGTFDQTVAAVDRFLPFVNNWATCDSMSPKIFAKEPCALLPYIERWLSSDKTYVVRYAIGLLMRYFLDERFSTRYADRVAAIRSEEYYVNMMIAWYFATGLAKQYDAILPYISEHRLPTWIHNKTIQKAVESYRVNDMQKQYLRAMRMK